jgi:hypothetical protein
LQSQKIRHDENSISVWDRCIHRWHYDSVNLNIDNYRDRIFHSWLMGTYENRYIIFNKLVISVQQFVHSHKQLQLQLQFFCCNFNIIRLVTGFNAIEECPRFGFIDINCFKNLIKKH